MNFRKASIFQRDTEKPEEQNDSGGMLAVWGSPGSGKTVTAAKIAKMLSARKKNVILLLCDMAAPMLPCICPADALESKASLAGVLAAARISENLIKHNLVTFKRNSCLAVLGLLERQNEYSTPPFTQKQVVELLDGLRQIAPYVIVDCGSYIANDILSAVALMEADSILRLANCDPKSVNYTRALKELGIAVIFEKENINSLEEDSELRITLSGAFAQSESESISANVTWGKRRAMESGKATIQYKYLYGYRRGADDKPEIIPEEAEVVRWIYERYLAGASTRMLRDELHEQGVIYSEKSPQWTLPHIKSILRNEKYCGDVLMQKTFQQDVINRKIIKNTGQLPMYLIENHHEGIVSREKYNAVQAEMARRKAAKSPSKRASTGLSAYTSRYALSDRLVCGECGTLYRRCTWTRPDGKRVVWRCVSRLDYGKKYCHSSPTLDEVPLQQAIIAALNTVLPDLDGRIRQITEALEAEVIPFPGSGMSLGDIDRRLTELEAQFQRLLEKAADDPIAYGDQFKEILDEQTALKELRATILAENKKHAEADRRIRDAAGMLENAVPHIAEWDESAIRQLVAQVKVLSKNEISVTLKSGIEIRQSISN